MLNRKVHNMQRTLVIILSFFTASVFAKQPVIVDTDMGADDAIAILYLLQQPQIDVKAISVVGTGLAHCQRGADNAKRMLQLVQRSDIPVACGARNPLQITKPFPSEWRTWADDFFDVPLPILEKQSTNTDSIDLMRRVIASSDKPMTILAIGPLTNLAKLFEKQPKLKQKIQRIVIMGGAVNVEGNVGTVIKSINNQTAEWNIYVDPEAAKQVFDSGVPIDLVSLDSTNKVMVTEEMLTHFKAKDQNNRNARLAATILAKQMPYIIQRIYFLWDPLAAEVLVHPENFEYNATKLTVVTALGSDLGKTAIDEQHGNIINVIDVRKNLNYVGTLINGLSNDS